jgi:anti-sigma regulatory factor (Ser/Thr protein kinase)
MDPSTKIINNNYLNKPQYLVPEEDVYAGVGDDFSVLADRETIKNIAKSICNTLRHPVTILDINRLGKQQNSILRIESDIEYLSLRGACKFLRHFAGKEICYECDNFHATMLKDMMCSMSRDELKERISIKLKEMPASFVPSYSERIPEVHEIPYQQDKSDMYRLVIEYHCPLLGYRELLFPIFYDDFVIGALFVGQTVIRSKDKKIIRDIQNEFFDTQANDPKNIFTKLLSNYDRSLGKNKMPTNINELKRMILNADKPFEKIENYLAEPGTSENTGLTNMTFDSYEKYLVFISRACQELTKVEHNLAGGAKTKRVKYFESIVENAVKKYFNSSIHEYNTEKITYAQQLEGLENAWNCFYDAKEMIKNDLDLVEVLLICDGMRMNVEGNKKKSVYSKETVSTDLQEWGYDFSRLKNKLPSLYEPLISLKEPDILYGLHRKFDRTNVMLLVYPDVVLLLKVKELDKYKELYTEMAESIGKGFSRIYSDVALRSANYMKEHHTHTLRMYRHESAHISTRLNDNISMYFTPNRKHDFFDLEEEKQKHVYEDMKNTISLISHMADNIGIIIGSINANVIKGQENTLDVTDLLYKWQIMFRSRLHGRNLDIEVLRSSDTDAPRFIRTNTGLFELLVYNLVDNAVKYAYRGSVIRLSWSRPGYNCNYYELTITSYGPKMDLGERPYELYTRGYIHEGKRYEPNSVEGDGMGLYVVKHINELLNLDGVSHTCEYILPYNVPLIRWYRDEHFSNEHTHVLKKKELLDYLKKNPDLDMNNIINHNVTRITRRDLSEEYLDARIDKETWLTTFTVKVSKDFKI